MLTITDGWIKIRIQSQTEPVEVDFLIVVGGIAGLMAAIIIQQVAKISANPAMARKQTRFPLYHYRADFTETDDEKHCGRIVVRRGLDEKPTMRF